METIAKKTFTFYHDPGHGWLKVNKKDLVELSLEDKISRYSYQSGDNIYLEEDCDATLFQQSYKAKYGELIYKEVYQDNIFIRRLPGYERI